MPQHWRWPALSLVLGGSIVGTASAQLQSPANPPPNSQPMSVLDAKPEARVLLALRYAPITAPYRFNAAWRNGRVLLTGRVATKVVHDAAVSIAGSTGVTIEDALVIDTAEAYRAGANSAQGQRNGPGLMAGGNGRMMPGGFAGAMAGGLGGSTVPYVYPQPLFGKYDDPFYGMEPPYISYPPWWGAITAARLDPPAMGMPSSGPDPGQQGAPAPSNPGSTTTTTPSNSIPTDGHVEMTIDPRGVAVLRGIVPTLNDKVAVGQKLAGSPGVTEIVNLLETRDALRPAGIPTAAPAPQPNLAVPPPSPENERPGNNPVPVINPARPPEPQPVAIAAAEDPLTTRLRQSIARRPILANLPVQVEGRDGVAYLRGKVPTAFEALAAFRAVQQTRGVRSVVDSLEFSLPDPDGKNPLIEQGRPEDVEPYLDAQIRRQVGDAAHVDRVRVNGDALEIRGTVPTADDKARIAAILRSMPLLRGYRIDAELRPE